MLLLTLSTCIQKNHEIQECIVLFLSLIGFSFPFILSNSNFVMGKLFTCIKFYFIFGKYKTLISERICWVNKTIWQMQWLFIPHCQLSFHIRQHLFSTCVCSFHITTNMLCHRLATSPSLNIKEYYWLHVSLIANLFYRN